MRVRVLTRVESSPDPDSPELAPPRLRGCPQTSFTLFGMVKFTTPSAFCMAVSKAMG